MDFSVSALLSPWEEPEDYVQEIEGRGIVYDDDENEKLIGTIEATFINVIEATNHDESLFNVCDATSAELAALFEVFFTMDGEPREDWGIEPLWDNVLLIHGLKLEDEFKESKAAGEMVRTTMAMFGAASLVAAIESHVKLPVTAWKRLGFKRIADSGFVYCDPQHRNEYEEKGW